MDYERPLSSRERKILRDYVPPERQAGIEYALVRMEPYARYVALECLIDKERWNEDKTDFSTFRQNGE